MRLKLWLEREQLDVLDPPTDLLQHFWNAGTGLRFQMCEYSHSQSALLKLSHIAYCEFYQCTVDGAVLNDDAIGFTDTRNPNLPTEPLIEQLFAVKGCKLSTMEAMIKLYRSEVFRLPEHNEKKEEYETD